MTLLVLLLALALDTWAPWAGRVRLPARPIDAFDRLAQRWVARHRSHRTLVAWMAVGVPAGVVALLHAGLAAIAPLLAFAFDAVVLGLCIGLHALGRRVLAAREAIARGDLEALRGLDVAGGDTARAAPSGGVEPRVPEWVGQAVLQAHRRVFGVVFAFVALAVLGLGPAGAVLYAVAWGWTRRWHDGTVQMPPVAPPDPALTESARRVFAFIDHVPARMTAAGFAVVGDFERAMASWRSDASAWDDLEAGVVLAAAYGAVGLGGDPRDGGRAGSASGAAPGAPFAATGRPAAMAGTAGPPAAACARDAQEADTLRGEGQGPFPPPAEDAAEGGVGASEVGPAGLDALAALTRALVGLVVRAMWLWLLTLALLTFANVVG